MEHHEDGGPNGRTPPGFTPRRRKDAVDEEQLNDEATGGFQATPVPADVLERINDIPREMAASIGRPELEQRIRDGELAVVSGKPYLTMKGVKLLADKAGLELPIGLREPGHARRIGPAARPALEIFRQGRLEQPTSIEHALRQLYLAEELYEHAQESAVHYRTQYYAIAAEETDLRERCIACLVGVGDRPADHEELVGRLTAPSRNQAEKLVDTAPAMVRYLKRKRDWAGAKDVAEKELSVARRRHTTALTFVFAVAMDSRFLPEISAEQSMIIGEEISRASTADAVGAIVGDAHHESHVSLTTDQEK